MRRRITPQVAAETKQVVSDYKQTVIEELVGKIPDKMSFLELGDLIGRSDEWVRVRLVQQKERLLRIGRYYFVPRGVAVEFVRSSFM